MAGLYIHIPFRNRDRAYDDAFVSARTDVNYEAFTDAMAREIYQQAESHGGELPLRSVYAGGGRPSLAPLEAMVPLLRAVNQFETDHIDEVSAELSPRDATQRYVKGLTTMGFNRLVVSALSFNDAELNVIGAPHTTHDVYECLKHVRAAGIENISLDVTFGWPESTLNSWKQTLETVVECEVPHVTLLEWPAHVTDEAQELLRTKQYRYALQYLQEHGFEPYEISHFAQPGYRSKHNENYWAHGSFLGIGPAAHSFWWYPESENPRRWANVQDVEEYAHLLAQGQSPVSVRQAVDRNTLAEEYLMLRLRVIEGLDMTYYRRRYSVDLKAEHGALLDRLHENDLIRAFDDDRLRLTDAGRLVCNQIVRRLLPE
ncbi:coproporphyrinogen III oxidase [Longimonas halophila]|uniref:Coproporphyrinogen III oxidase n=1 Tax=Longimonas halophila TaxID=1469170 RepID=A0A2H3NNP6_9BACT|nr:radical SAM protein [Longimonas halophila]PEN06613.1 coproporphyrinogen III oxidase [Longimonas halophila]